MTFATSRQVCEGLQAHLTPKVGWPVGLLVFEVEAPRKHVAGRGKRGRGRRVGPRRRADAIWVPRAGVDGPQIHGFEVKVTRSDLLAELNEPAKCTAWKQYCNRWWLVVGDKKILAGLEDRIPASWGILAPPKRANWSKMETVRAAPALSPVDQGPAYNRLICREAYHKYANTNILEA